MKMKLIIIFTVLCLALSGCAQSEGEVIIIKPENEIEEVHEIPSPSPLPEAEKADEVIEAEIMRESVFTARPEDAYDMYGYTHFCCEESGDYEFTVQGSRNLVWYVYILEEEFTDAERYIPQVYSMSLQGEGVLSLSEGNFVYILCSANAWTGQEIPPEGGSMSVYFVG